MKNRIVFILLCIILPNLGAQAVLESIPTIDTQLPLKRIVIFSSGLSYYEHSGDMTGPISIGIPFRLEAVNDALKSLIINDPESANPSVTYQSENTLLQTLRSLKVDLSDNPGMAVILSRLIGSEIEALVPGLHFATRQQGILSGRIAGIEYKPVIGAQFVSNEPHLLVSTEFGLVSSSLNDIVTIKFKDPAIEKDLSRALDLIAESGNSSSRELKINLPGRGRRNVSISYVISSPVWKVSYRLDLQAEKPLFQGWAIIDNISDNDWNNVSLSLVAGRPSSFIQNLYPPYHVSRPVLPLSIAGTADAVVHDRSSPTPQAAEVESMMMRMDSYAQLDERERRTLTTGNITGGTVQTATGSEAGGQFEFTIKNPVSLNRMMSAMLLLTESNIEARKFLIYSGTGRNPRLGAELTNTTGMKLPAGPITVYDGGVYAGDALIDFWNENEKRLISFGEDLSVTAAASDTSSRTVSSVNIAGGVMTINRSQNFIKTYTFINSGSDSKNMVVEHTKTTQTELVSPQAVEHTVSTYRFNLTLLPNRESTLTVNEMRPLSERITLLSLRTDAFLSYASNNEIPQNVRQALSLAVELRRAVEAAEAKVKEIEANRISLAADQDRIRRNLEAAGNQTAEGQEYLRRMTALDREIDAIAPALEKTTADAKTAQEAYERYLLGLSF